MAYGCIYSLKRHHWVMCSLIGAGTGEVVERLLGRLNDMTRDEGGTLSRSLLGTLYTALPLHHRPTAKAVLRQLREDAGEIYLPVTQRAEAPSPFDPGLVAAVDNLPARRMKLGIFYMKHFYAVVIEIEELQVVELLQHEMAGIEQHVASGMLLDPLQEHLKGDAIVQVFSGMDLET